MLGKEQRTGLTLIGLREAIRQMLANSLTKGHEKWQLDLYSKGEYQWRIVYEEKFEGAKRRKTCGFRHWQHMAARSFGTTRLTTKSRMRSDNVSPRRTGTGVNRARAQEARTVVSSLSGSQASGIFPSATAVSHDHVAHGSRGPFLSPF